jgi:hypothetical protein
LWVLLAQGPREIECSVPTTILTHTFVRLLMSVEATDCYGQKWYDADGKLHRDGDSPAVVSTHGDQCWYQHGKRHRDGDLPAVVDAYGTKAWYKHGEFHRDGDLPAVVVADGSQYWYQHGRCHRSHDLPAVVLAGGRQEWWVDGRLQSDLDRAQTRRVMAEARRWSALRAAFVGAACTRAA